MPQAEAFLYASFLLVIFFIYLRINAVRKNRQRGLNIFNAAKSMTIGSKELQEDAADFAYKTDGTMMVLADGMGREYAGRISSNVAVGVIKEFFASADVWSNPQYFIRESFNAANRKILEELRDKKGGASVAMALIHDGKLMFALAGNVQVAVHRNGELISLSSGHTIGSLAIKRWKEGRLTSEDARQVKHNRRVYNYLGQDDFQEIEIMEEVQLEAGDTVVLMSDGVYDCLRWRDIEQAVGSGKKAADAAYEVIELVNESEKDFKDNASVILLRL